MKKIEFLHDTRARLGLLLEGLDDLAEFLGNVRVELFVGQGEVVLLAEGDHHATEVLADKVLEERGASVAFWSALLLENLIGQLGAGLEGEFLGKDEGVVAVEKDGGDLSLSACGALKGMIKAVCLP